MTTKDGLGIATPARAEVCARGRAEGCTPAGVVESRVLSLDDLAPRIRGLRTMEKTLIELRDTAKHSVEAGSRKQLTRDDGEKTTQEVRDVLEKGSFSERRHMIHSLVTRIDVEGDYLDITLDAPLPEFPPPSPDEPVTE